MKRRSLILFFLLIVALCATGAVVAQKGGKGGGGNGGGGGANQEVLAEFLFPVVPGVLNTNGTLAMTILTGDQTSGAFSSYKNDEIYPGVSASFMGSGNPKLTLGDPFRSLIVKFEDNIGDDGGCGIAGDTFPVNGDSLWFANTANDPDWREPYADSYQVIDGAFLGMTPGINEAYGMFILRFVDPDDSDVVWRAIFGDWPGATNPSAERTRVKITVEDRDVDGNPIHWRIVGLDENSYSSAGVTSIGPKVKGQQQVADHGYCRTVIDFDIRIAQ